MKHQFAVAAVLVACMLGPLPQTLLYGQAAPTVAPSATVPGANTVPVADVLAYSLSASDSAIFGYNGVNGTSNSFNIAGNASYVTGSLRYPTSFLYSGGYLFGNNGQPSSPFHNFGISQVFATKKFTVVGSDIVSYLPNAPRFGLSGVPGVGDIGTGAITGNPTTLPGDTVLTNYGKRVTNTEQAGADYRITNATGLHLLESYQIERFPDGAGLDNNMGTAALQFDHRFGGKTTLGGGFNYMRSSFPDSDLTFSSKGFVGVYQHQFSPNFGITASAGPQWTSGSNAQLLPSRLSAQAAFSLSYSVRRTSTSVIYNRGTNAGAGVLFGSISDNLGFAVQHAFTPKWQGAFTTQYGRAQSLAELPGLENTASNVSIGVQANRRLGQDWSAFGSYAFQDQHVSTTGFQQNAFNGTAHVISFGITYSPRPVHFAHRR